MKYLILVTLPFFLGLSLGRASKRAPDPIPAQQWGTVNTLEYRVVTQPATDQPTFTF